MAAKVQARIIDKANLLLTPPLKVSVKTAIIYEILRTLVSRSRLINSLPLHPLDIPVPVISIIMRLRRVNPAPELNVNKLICDISL
jgi:hypothetical protein